MRADWENVQYKVFDAPEHGGEFCERQAFIAQIALPEHCSIVEQVPCFGALHLENLFNEITAQGGEGVILRAPKSHYFEGRSDEFLKLKKETTLEAVVSGYHYKDGLFRSVKCKLEDVEFKMAVGCDVPDIGSLVTFSCFDFTDAGLPRSPKFVAVRNYE